MVRRSHDQDVVVAPSDISVDHIGSRPCDEMPMFLVDCVFIGKRVEQRFLFLVTGGRRYMWLINVR